MHEIKDTTQILYTLQQLLDDISQNGAEFKRLKDELASNFAFYPKELVAGAGQKGRPFQAIYNALLALHAREAKQIHLRNICNLRFTAKYQGETLNILQILKRAARNRSLLSALDAVRKKFPGQVDTAGQGSFFSDSSLSIKEIDVEKKKLVVPQTKIPEAEFATLYRQLDKEVKTLNALKNYMNGRIVVPRDLDPGHIEFDQTL